MICKVCNDKVNKLFVARVLSKYDITYFYCNNCGFLSTEEPYWLGEAYSEAISLSDIGMLNRNIALKSKLEVIIYFLFNKKAKFVDYAGGYGIFTRLMRDVGFDFYWQDLYANNIFSKGFEYHFDKIELVTAFEAFEHFVNPIEEIDKVLKISENVIFTTEVLPDNITKCRDWWYFGFEHGQHVAFYSQKTLLYISQRVHLNYYKISANVHLLTKKEMNKTMLQGLYKLANYGLDCWVGKRMESRSKEDLRLLKNGNLL